MKWKRTAMSLALAGCMMATTVPVTAFAASTNTATVASTQGTWSDGLTANKITLSKDSVTVANTDTNDIVVTMQVAADILSEGKGKVEWKLNDTKDLIDEGQSGVVATSEEHGIYTITLKPNTLASDVSGTATVVLTLTTDNGTKVTKTLTVNVVEPIYATDVAVNSASMTVKKGDNKTIKTTCTPSNATVKPAITWKSENSNIATVNASTGEVTGVAFGTVGIIGTATFTDAKGNQTTKNISVEVTVTDPTASITVVDKDDQTADSVYVNDTKQLKVKFTEMEETSVSWKSSNSSVATVDSNGLVTAKGAGTATITATAGDKEAYYTLTVKEAGKSATGIALDKTSMKLSQGSAAETTTDAVNDTNAQVKLVMTPEEADADITVNSIMVNGTAVNNQTAISVSDMGGNKYYVAAADNATVGSYRVAFDVTVDNKDANADDLTKTLVLNVEVVEANESIASDLTLTANIAEDYNNIVANQTFDLADVVTTAVTPTSLASKVAYSIDDTSVAQLYGNAEDGYQIVAKKAGSCVLTAKIGNLSKSIVLSVAAEADTDKLGGIQIDKILALTVDQKSSPIAVEALIGDNDEYETLPNKYTVIWSSSDESVATVDENGVVKGKKAGTATITATVGNFTATCKVTVVDENTTPSTGFVDVPANAWYADAVNTAAAKGLMNGTGNNKFEPLKTVQRSQVAAIVWNIEGAPAVTGTTPFTDVAADAWYAQAVTWAYQNKVVSGTSATTFAPNQNITRQDFAVVLYNKAGKPAASADLSKFVDASKINSWAQDAVKWAVSKGIINGNDKNELNPTGTLTRAEAASIIVKYVG